GLVDPELGCRAALLTGPATYGGRDVARGRGDLADAVRARRAGVDRLVVLALEQVERHALVTRGGRNAVDVAGGAGVVGVERLDRGDERAAVRLGGRLSPSKQIDGFSRIGPALHLGTGPFGGIRTSSKRGRNSPSSRTKPRPIARPRELTEPCRSSHPLTIFSSSWSHEVRPTCTSRSPARPQSASGVTSSA